MKIVEAIKCYFSLFMSKLNLSFLYYILFQPIFKQKRNFLYRYTLCISLLKISGFVRKDATSHI